jgi:hypothetical protein
MSPLVTSGSGMGGSPRTIAKPKPSKKAPNPPNRQSQILVFYGYQHGLLKHDFQVLCGPQPPTITSTPSNIAVIDRPRSTGYTVPTGYDPITTDFQIRFENWIDYALPVNKDVEGDISKLMWMANRGKLGPGRPGQGNPPILKVRAFDTTANDIPLIPPDIQGLEWVISNIQWDPTPLRLTSDMIKARKLSVPVGTRARQDATVTLMQWSPAPGFATTKRKPAKGNFAKYSDAAYWNIRLMTNRYCGKHTQADYKTVMQLPANKHLKIRHPGQRLKNHTKVFFPNSLEEV